MENKRLVRKWTSLRGKYWVELYLDSLGYSYRMDNGGGSLGAVDNLEDAILRLHLSTQFPGKFKEVVT